MVLVADGCKLSIGIVSLLVLSVGMCGLMVFCTEEVKLCTLSAAHCIVGLTPVVDVVVALDPLEHLEVILILRTHQLGGLWS